MSEKVYVLTNEAMPGLVKIGFTSQDDVVTRMTQLTSHPGVPLPFECFFAAEAENGKKLENILHQIFAENRVNPKREFFRLDKEKVVLAISIGQFKEVTPGDVLVLWRDESLQAKVMVDGKVEFQGETLSLSLAALKALHQLGYKTPSASGPEYWVFDGELLDERRRRLETEQFDQSPPSE